MNIKTLHIWILILALWTCANEQAAPQTEVSIEINETNKTECEPGEKITLNFEGSDTSSYLYYSSSYGNSLLSPIIQKNRLLYVIPEHVTNKVGVINWKLIQSNKTSQQGQLTVLFSDKVKAVETYFGPTFLYAGPSNFSHLVSIPVDSLDNPIKKNSEVVVKEQFKTAINSSSVYTNHLIAFQIIYSKKTTGRFLINSECNGISSQELAATVSSAIPSNFIIQIDRSHPFADGNQIATFTSSVIKDNYGNIINDGTLVKFIIKNKNGNLTYTTANSINGIATAKMIHPSHKQIWEVQAFVMGMAESNVLSVDFLQSITDYQVLFSDKNKTIDIGPIKGFMEQLVPDGVRIELRVIMDEHLVKTLHSETLGGYGHFSLKNSTFKPGNYTLEFEIAGIKKIFKNKAI